MALPPASKRFVESGAALGLDIDVHVFPDGTKTARDAAEAIGCELAQITKSLVFMVDGRPIVSLVPGDLRLDPVKLACAVGGETARRASLEEVRAATGYSAGGTPPFGHPSKIEMLADERLRRHDDLWAAAGTPTTVFPISCDDLLRVTGARWVDVTEGK